MVDGDGGAGMVDAWTASPFFSSMSPLRLLAPCSPGATVFVEHLTPTPSPPWSPTGFIPPWSPTGFIPLWDFDDEQRLPQQMGPTANCSAAVLEAAPQDTSDGIATSRVKLEKVFIRYERAAIRLQLNTTLILKGKAVYLLRDLVKIDLSCGLETGGCSWAMIESYDDDNELGDNDTEQTEISRKRPTKSLLCWLRFTKFKQLAATIRGRVKTFLSQGLEKYMNTETGGCSLAMIESFDDDDNELGDNDAEQAEISRKRPRNSSLDLIHSTKETEQLAAAIRNLEKSFLSVGAEIHMNTETAGSSLAIIESYDDDDDQLGDNDAEQTEISRKRPRNSSPVWLHFSKVLSKDSGMVTAMCKHCNNALTGASTYGTSHLLRHLKNTHQMDLSSSSEACKEVQCSSSSQKLQITGSAACAGNPTPLSENNGNEIELQDKDFELGDTSRKRLKGTSRTKSDVWLHFTKLPSADPRGVMAECNYCKSNLKADSQIGTSHLWRHFKKAHVEKAMSNDPN